MKQSDLFARGVGQELGELCERKAERDTSFDGEAAGAFIVGWLRSHGRCSGEVLVDRAVAQGHRPHDGRAFGPVFARLVKRGAIRCVGFGTRSKGHGTAGLRIWEARP